MQEIIITGASRGFGRHVALKLAKPGKRLHLISRTEATETAAEVRKLGAEARIWSIDLSNTAELEKTFTPVLDSIKAGEVEFIGLINNAGTLKPVGPLGKYDTEQYRDHLELNYVSPAVLTHLFIKRYQAEPTTKRVLFVGSGASQRPIHGWSHYCSSKAGVDMLAKTIALEQDSMDHKVETAVFNPGRIETDMQELIRELDKEDFPLVDDFIASAKDGRNLPPGTVAEKLAHIFTGNSYPHGEIAGR